MGKRQDRKTRRAIEEAIAKVRETFPKVWEVADETTLTTVGKNASQVTMALADRVPSAAVSVMLSVHYVDGEYEGAVSFE